MSREFLNARKYTDIFSKRVAIDLLSTFRKYDVPIRQYGFDDSDLSQLKFKFSVAVIKHPRKRQAGLTGRPPKRFLTLLISKIERYKGDLRMYPDYNAIWLEATIPRPQ